MAKQTAHAETFAGVVGIDDLARVLKTSDDTIRRRLAQGTFPIPLLPKIDARYRWWGPAVLAWLAVHGPTVDRARRPEARGRKTVARRRRKAA